MTQCLFRGDDKHRDTEQPVSLRLCVPGPDDSNLVKRSMNEIPRPGLLNSCFAWYNSALFCELLGDGVGTAGVAAGWSWCGDLIKSLSDLSFNRLGSIFSWNPEGVR